LKWNSIEASTTPAIQKFWGFGFPRVDLLRKTGFTCIPTGAQYAGCIIAAAGLYMAVGIPISWTPNNLPSHFKRATGQGTSMAGGNCA
jgi:hypothetical protein